MTEPDRPDNQDKTKNRKIIGALTALLILLILLIGLFRSCDSGRKVILPDTSQTGIVYDDGAVEGGWTEADTDEIISNLNEKVEEGMINISANTSPIFKSGTAEGNIMIVNEKVNRYPQVVEITRNDTGELIYKSNAIPVGSKIEKAKLASDLDKGTYECTAMFHNVDPVTGAYIGSAGAIINLTVLS